MEPPALRRRLLDLHGPLIALCLVVTALALPRPAVARTDRAVMLLRIAEEDRPQESLRIRLSEHLMKAGVLLLDPSGIPAAERACEQPDCLAALAAEYHADLILTARIGRQAGSVRVLLVTVYDSGRGRDEFKLDSCAVEDVEAHLRQLASDLIQPYLAPPDPPVDSGGAPTPPLPVQLQPAPQPAKRKLSKPRIWTAIGLGTLALGALGTAIALQAVSGQAAGLGCRASGADCVYDYTPIFLPMYTVAGALAIGTALTLAFPAKMDAK